MDFVRLLRRRALAIRLCASVGVAALAFASADAEAQETMTYGYDALGRLTGSNISGGPNSGTVMGTCFDPAGNRTQYVISTSSSSCSSTPTPSPSPTPSPTPTPTPTNSPPVAVSDSTSFHCSLNKTLNVLANDYDPDGNTPLSLVSVTSSSPSLWASVSGTTSIVMGASSPGTYSVDYVVQDSLGATATGWVSVTVTGNSSLCQEPPLE